MPLSTTTPGQLKVAIPRLPRPGQGQAMMKERRRVPRACTACRSHKIKCTGERPLCRHCATTNRECVYIMPRKDRLKMSVNKCDSITGSAKVGSVTERCQQMAGLLNVLSVSASAADNIRIAELLGGVCGYTIGGLPRS